jgi:hypothetical protein
MAWFLQFYQKIPQGTPPRDYSKYHVGRQFQLDISLPTENKPCPHERVADAIQQFQESYGVQDWREVADHYETFEIDYI